MSKLLDLINWKPEPAMKIAVENLQEGDEMGEYKVAAVDVWHHIVIVWYEGYFVPETYNRGWVLGIVRKKR